jgi:hypothetical protein
LGLSRLGDAATNEVYWRQRCNAVHPISIRDATVVFSPRRLLRVAKEVRACDVMVDADFGASEAWEVLLSHVSASAIEAVCLLMIDSLDLEAIMQIVLWRRFVGIDYRAGRDERSGWAFSIWILPGLNFRCVPGSQQQPSACLSGSWQSGDHGDLPWGWWTWRSRRDQAQVDFAHFQV